MVRSRPGTHLSRPTPTAAPSSTAGETYGPPMTWRPHESTPTSPAARGARRGTRRFNVGNHARRSPRRSEPSSSTPLSLCPRRPVSTWACHGLVRWAAPLRPVLAEPRSAERSKRSVFFWSRGGDLVHHLNLEKCCLFFGVHTFRNTREFNVPIGALSWIALSRLELDCI